MPGNVEESLLIEAVNYESLEMPPDGPLASREIAILADWVKRGAPWPERKGAAGTGAAGKISDEDRGVLGVSATGEPRGARR